MSHARVEEVDSDSDPDMMDISALPADSNDTIIPASQIQEAINPSRPPHPQAQPTVSRNVANAPPPESKNWHLLYPIYFDASVPRSGGRRVSSERAVTNPLAMKIAEAATEAGFSTVFEPGKTHPKDWANPGRVRVRLRSEKGGEWVAPNVKNKHHLYHIISEYLLANPTQDDDPLMIRIRGLPEFKEPLPPPAVPRGWKVNSIVPTHSAAVTGGGVSENLFKEFQNAMQGQQGGLGLPAPPGPSTEKKKKEKGKKK